MTAGRPDYTLDKVLAHLSLNAHHRAVGSAQFYADHLGCRGLLPAVQPGLQGFLKDIGEPPKIVAVPAHTY